jgi:uncharacterized protein (TIGR00730 family)
MKSICVYLGAKPGKGEYLNEAAIKLGQLIAKKKIRLIYGGSSHGLMGILANEVLAYGGQVTGIMPKSILEIEKPLSTIDELIITDTMQERKQLLQQHADAFIVMPGGLGTLEEAFETWNAIKIGLFQKPIGFLNLNHFYDGLFSFMTGCEQEGFITSKQLNIPLIESNPEKLLDGMNKLIIPNTEVTTA